MAKQPAKKAQPRAKKAFTAKQKADARKEHKQDLKDLKKEVVAAKTKNNQDHFSFATAIVAGGGVANFIAFQGAGINDIAGKALTTVTMGGLLYGLNKDFFFTSGVYKEMLRVVNKQLEEIDNPVENTFADRKPLKYKKLFDDSVKVRKEKIKQKVKLKSTYNVRAANSAVVIITSIALANLCYTMYEKGLNTKSEISSDLKIKPRAEGDSALKPLGFEKLSPAP